MQVSKYDLVWVQGFQNSSIPNMHFSFNETVLQWQCQGCFASILKTSAVGLKTNQWIRCCHFHRLFKGLPVSKILANFLKVLLKLKYFQFPFETASSNVIAIFDINGSFTF